MKKSSSKLILLTSVSAVSLTMLAAIPAMASPSIMTLDAGGDSFAGGDHTTYSGKVATTSAEEDVGAKVTGLGYPNSFRWEVNGNLLPDHDDTSGFLVDITGGTITGNFNSVNVTGNDKAGITIITARSATTNINVNGTSRITGDSNGDDSAGIYVDSTAYGATIINIGSSAAVINGSGDAGIDIVDSSVSGSITNYGTVSGGSSGHGINAGIDGLLSYITNYSSGIINGGTTGTSNGLNIEANNSGSNGVSTITNYGSINGGNALGDGIVVTSTGRVGTIDNDGIHADIKGGGSSSSGINISGSAVVTNIYNRSTAIIEGTGLAGSGISVSGSAAVTNIENKTSATIKGHGTSGSGISVSGSATVTTITNKSSAIIQGAGSGAGVNVSGTATVTTIDNKATIQGGGSSDSGIKAGSTAIITTINNYSMGTIIGDKAINLTNTNHSTTINTGGTITGDIQLGSTEDGDIVNIFEGTIDGDIIASDDSYGTVNFNLVDSRFGTGGASGTTHIFETDGSIGVTDNLYAVNVNSGTLILNNKIAADTTTIASGSTLRINEDELTINGAVVNNGTLNLQANMVTIEGNISGTGQISLTIEATSSGKHGYIYNDSSGTVNLSSMVIAPNFTSGDVVAGEKLVIINQPDELSFDPVSMISTNGIKWTLSQATMSGSDYQGIFYSPLSLIATASLLDSGVIATNSGALNPLSSYSGSNADIIALQSGLTDTTDNNKAGSQLRPDANGGGILTALDIINQSRNNITTRLNDIGTQLSGDTNISGVSTGGIGKNTGIWASGFGSFADQDTTKSVDGFKADVYGSTFGADSEIRDNLRIGAAFTYANASVDDKGTRSGSGEDINSYIANIYSSYNFNPFYVDVVLTAADHEYNTKRLVDFTGSTLAEGNFRAMQYGAKTEVGYPVQLRSFTITPLAGFTYDKIHQDGYTETGAGGANLVVDGSDVNSYRSTIGVRASSLYNLNDEWKIRPGAELSYKHEFNDSIVPDQFVSFEAGGVSFTTPGLDLPQDALAYGAGIELISAKSFSMTVHYDGEYRSNYINNGFTLKGRLDF